jgi:hypothetical protein
VGPKFNGESLKEKSRWGQRLELHIYKSKNTEGSGSYKKLEEKHATDSPLELPEGINTLIPSK